MDLIRRLPVGWTPASEIALLEHSNLKLMQNIMSRIIQPEEPINFGNVVLDSMVQYLGNEWTIRLKQTLLSPEFDRLYDFLEAERASHTVYPTDNATVFRAFKVTPFEDVRVVILGQDPYHDGSADGLAFSNSGKLNLSPSLRIIYDELERTVYNGMMLDKDPDLSRWARQGVLLLNTALTVRKKEPDSHAKQWDFFTRAVFDALNSGHTGLVYMLWGAKAQAYKKYINVAANHVLEAAHPASVIYGGKGWYGNNHFNTANSLLHGMNGYKVIW